MFDVLLEIIPLFNKLKNISMKTGSILIDFDVKKKCFEDDEDLKKDKAYKSIDSEYCEIKPNVD